MKLEKIRFIIRRLVKELFDNPLNMCDLLIHGNLRFTWDMDKPNI